MPLETTPTSATKKVRFYDFYWGHCDTEGEWRRRPNSCDGYGVTFKFVNLNERTIKYAFFTFVPFNAVGDAVGETICVKITGPIIQYETKTHCNRDIYWYERSLNKVKFVNLSIIYMDDEEEKISFDEILFEAPKPAYTPSSGCYVATAVYGSYDCPEVWTLRRYRDFWLAKKWYGRLFIRIYYAISPTLVKWFGNKKWFQKLWKKKLDKMVNSLKTKGFESTPYVDRVW